MEKGENAMAHAPFPPGFPQDRVENAENGFFSAGKGKIGGDRRNSDVFRQGVENAEAVDSGLCGKTAGK